MNTTFARPGQAGGGNDDDAPGERVLRSGRYRGKRLRDCPEPYLRHLLALPHLNDDFRSDVEDALGVDQPEHPHDDGNEPRPDSAAVRLPLVVWTWEGWMRTRHADDPLALEVVAVGSARLRELCAEATGRPWPRPEGGEA
jgi:hypothetical protein